jgi:heme ABC exporter ATP-binding subunit CcmA
MSGTTAPCRLELRGLAKRFGRQVVLRALDLRVHAGEIVGLTGPNGAGKTTLLAIVAGLMPPDEGEYRLDGEPLDEVGIEHRRRIALVAHATQLYPLLTARENLELFVDLRAAAGSSSQASADLLARLGLAEVAERPVGRCSRGMAQRVALARGLSAGADLLLLDEPFTALDSHGRALLVDLLREERARGVAILLSSHDGPALRDLADRIVHLEGGALEGNGLG